MVFVVFVNAQGYYIERDKRECKGQQPGLPGTFNFVRTLVSAAREPLFVFRPIHVPPKQKNVLKIALPTVLLEKINLLSIGSIDRLAYQVQR
jgi:hypothetical protein